VTAATGGKGDVLVASSNPAARDALRYGHQARPAAQTAAIRRAEYNKRLERPLPPEGTRERRWALENRAAYLKEVEGAEAEARTLTERWARAMDRLAENAPDELYDAVDAAVWGQD